MKCMMMRTHTGRQDMHTHGAETHAHTCRAPRCTGRGPESRQLRFRGATRTRGAEVEPAGKASGCGAPHDPSAPASATSPPAARMLRAKAGGAPSRRKQVGEALEASPVVCEFHVHRLKVVRLFKLRIQLQGHIFLLDLKGKRTA